MASKTKNVKRPENMQHTLRIFVSYLGRHKFMLLIVSILVTVSALANLLGTYMIRPVVNNLANGDLHSLAIGVLVAAGIFAIGALAAWGYSQTMVKAAQQVVFDIRRDLFAHMQTLPLRFFDQKRHGDIMSLFTNDIDTIADALNNSFAMAIQSFIQMIGTLVILYILNWKLSLIVTVCYGIMFWYMKFSGAKSKVFYAKQQQSLGELDGYIEEMVSGQKVVKVFNHEQASLQEFLEKNPGAKIYMATTKGQNVYTEVSYEEDCYIMFGKESAGIPEEILAHNKDRCVRIPMLSEIRSLNLSNSVAVVLYEALRQNDFSQMQLMGHLTKFDDYIE